MICIGWEWVPSNISQWFRRWTILGKLAFLHIPAMLAGNLANFLRNCNICKQNKVYILCCRYIPVFGIPFIDRIDLPFLGYLHKKRRINYRCKNRDIIIIICMIILFWKKYVILFVTLMFGWVKMNSPREGSRVKPLTPFPVLNTSCHNSYEQSIQEEE